MAEEEKESCDLSDDMAEQLLFTQTGAFDEVAHDIIENSNLASAGLQFGQTQKFNNVDPLESASAEKILK